MPPVAADGGRVAGAVALDATAVHAHPHGHTGLPVAHEDVVVCVGVAGHEVRRPRAKGDIAPVVADGRVVAVAAAALAAGAGHADPLRGPGLPVVHEHVVQGVRIGRYEIRGQRAKGDVTPVAAYGGLVAAAVRLSAGAVHADPLRSPGLPGTREDG